MWWYYFLMRFDTTQPSFDLPFSQKPASLVVEWAERIRRRPVDKGIWKWKRQSLSCVWLCDPIDYTVQGILQARILDWVAFPFSRGSSQPRDRTPGLLCCRRILYQLSHKGSPRILEWVAYPFSSGSSQPRNRTQVSCIAGGFFTNWAIRKACKESRRALEATFESSYDGEMSIR